MLEFTNNLTRENSLTLLNFFFENNNDINLKLLISEVEEIEKIEINFKLVIKAVDKKYNAAKWKIIIEKETGSGTQLINKKDWEIFLKENKQIIFNKKVLLILVKMKRDPKKTRLSIKYYGITFKMQHNIAILNDPPMLPLFDATNNSTKKHKKTYGECNFDEVKNKFLQEEIDVLNILSLKDYDWQNNERN
ncbi:hypothetical protein C1646_777440 [Rhizophagus diaphanus]|nr:hypothetical protein C1646_777440 [Rhizophagus diaphanus] [Rhizophagus sp. MUCL 43196]